MEHFGLKFSAGGAHISRTMMLSELDTVLAAGLPSGRMFTVAISPESVRPERRETSLGSRISIGMSRPSASVQSIVV